jgi:colanic acid biosynthesis glycosyl transferase WcaI
MNHAPELTGIGRYTGQLVEALAVEGLRCTVVTTPPHYPQWQVTPPYKNRYRQQIDGSTDVIRCPIYIARSVRGISRLLAPLSFALSSAPVVVWKILRHRPDIVVVVEPTLFAAPAALLASRLSGSKTILHVQDLEIDAALEVGHLKRKGVVEKLARTFDQLMLRAFDGVVTISEAMRRGVLAKGVNPEKISVIRNWVDSTAIFPTGDQSYRRTLGVAADQFLVLYAGSVGAKQGIDLLCEAVASINPASGIVLVIVGEGPVKASLVERYGRQPHIRFFGLQPEDALNALLNAADLHVIPQLAGSSEFALPSKLGGILASGRPILILAHPDQELALFVGDVATVVEPTDAGRVAAALLRLTTQDTSDRTGRRVALVDELSKANAITRFLGLFERVRTSGGRRNHTNVLGDS